MTAELIDEKALFNAARLIESPADRAAYLREACGADANLRERVDALLRSYEEQASFLESPAAGVDDHPTVGLPVTERPGAMIGSYKLLQQIGDGGMGVVFMAEQTEPILRTVALKIIKPGMDTRQVIARFEAERQALALMDHPNIARVLDAGTTDSGRPYFVMELFKGVPITGYCDDHKLALRDRLELFMSVCEAVQHAHQKGIIHRDLKPTNVLVAEYDNRAIPKVIDFGVAKATAQRLTERTMFTEFGQVIGTVDYMSPEQAKLNQLDIDTRSDIYSLGVLLYEILTGSTPFERKRLREAAFDEVLRIIREEEPPKPSTRLNTIDALPSVAANRHTEPARLSKEVSGELDWIVMKALEKDRSRRYETANGLACDLERYLSDEPVQACPPSATYRFGKLVRRNKLVFAAAGAVTTALVLGLAVSSWLFFKERVARHRAQSEASKALAVSNLLQGMFSAASPEEFRKDYTVRELLDKYAESLGDQLKGQPETEAIIQEAIGNAYRSLGLADQAEPHLAVALALRERTFGRNSNEVARSLVNIGLVLFERRDLAGAESYVQGAYAIYKKNDLQSEDTLALLTVLQLVLTEQTKLDEAEAVSNEALALGKKLYPEGHRELASIVGGMARIAILRGQAVDAERSARESVAQHRRFHGDDHPQTAWGLFHLGWALQMQGRYEEAGGYFREALTIFLERYSDPAYIGTKLTIEHLRDILTAQGDQAGLKLVEDEVALHDGEAIAPRNKSQRSMLRGNYHRESGEWDKAIAEYSAVIAQRPDFAEAWRSRGSAYLLRGELAKALDDFSQAIALQPREWWNWHERAYVHQIRGEHKESIADHSRAIELNDSDSGQRLRRGQSYEALGKMDEAEADYSRAIALDPNYWENWTSRAFAYFRRQQWEQAVADFTKAIELAPEVHSSWLHRGHCYLQLTQWDKAAADFTKVTEGWRHDPGGWFFRSCAYAQLNQPDKAIGDLRQAIAEGFNDIAHLKSEPMLDPLRSSSAFKNMLAAMQAERK